MFRGKKRNGIEGDLVVTYKGYEFVIESKSLQTHSIKRVEDAWFGKAQCDGSDKRKVTFKDRSTLETTCLLAGDFDILAVNCFGFGNGWKFTFCKNSDLPLSTYYKYNEAQRAELLASLVPITWPPKPPFTEEPFSLMDDIIRTGKFCSTHVRKIEKA